MFKKTLFALALGAVSMAASAGLSYERNTTIRDDWNGSARSLSVIPGSRWPAPGRAPLEMPVRTPGDIRRMTAVCGLASCLIPLLCIPP